MAVERTEFPNELRLEERMAKVEGILEEISSRVNHLNTDIVDLRGDIREILQRMDSQFRWNLGIMLGVMIPMWVSIILAIIFSS